VNQPEKFIELTSARCVLRPLKAEDRNRLHELWTSPGIRRFLWDDEVIPIERTCAAIEQNQQMFEDLGYGLWGVWPSDTRVLSGFCGLWPFRDPPELELVYGISEDLWGKGYAIEAAQAVVAYCFDSLAMPVVRASTDVPNVASIRVLDKLGFEFVRRATIGGLDTVFYELPRRGGDDAKKGDGEEQ
jgi:ribosomal-protein-alanine N-acetyltransferase